MNRGVVASDYKLAGWKILATDSDYVYVKRYKRVILFNLNISSRYASLILDEKSDA